MSSELPPDLPPKRKKLKARKPELRVIFDTGALYVTPENIGSASDLVGQEIANVISEAKYPDLDILWYLPEIVRHERQYQMQAEALKLRGPINKIERLLSHNLALTDQTLVDHVKRKIEEKETELGLQEIPLDHTVVDWPQLVYAAVYRKPPFSIGEKEKGFRDAIVAESFLQLLSTSPKTPDLCRVVLVTSDRLLTLAVKERIANSYNASVLANVEELKGLINTIVSNVGEDFIAQIKPKADKLFFVSSDDKETLFYKEQVKKQLEGKFKTELEAVPQGTAFRRNSTWRIAQPNFSRKDGRRVFWKSRIEIELEAGTVTNENESKATTVRLIAPPKEQASNTLALAYNTLNTSPLASQDYLTGFDYLGGFPIQAKAFPAENRVVTHKGSDIFEVLWSTEVTMSKDLKKPKIEDITHVEVACQPIS